jgi:MFS family permease
MAIRLVAGLTSALVFVIAVNSMLDALRHHSPHLPGWGFGGIGVGIALSGALVLALPATAGWRGAWWTAAALAAVLSVGAWTMRHHAKPLGGEPVPTQPVEQPRTNRWFAALFVSYTLEGVGYIIAGTFLVAAINHDSPGWLGNGAWIFVGLAAAPSAALWAWLTGRRSHSTLLATALVLQAIGIALPVMSRSAAAALVGAFLFGFTFIGVSTIALAAGKLAAFPRAVALLTAGYSAGQILGPLLVAPLLHNGFRGALIVGAAVVASAALVAGLPRSSGRSASLSPAPAVGVAGGQPGVVTQVERSDITRERVDDRVDRRTVLVVTPYQ